jgi:hypothetical protein
MMLDFNLNLHLSIAASCVLTACCPNFRPVGKWPKYLNFGQFAAGLTVSGNWLPGGFFTISQPRFQPNFQPPYFDWLKNRLKIPSILPSYIFVLPLFRFDSLNSKTNCIGANTVYTIYKAQGLVNNPTNPTKHDE